MTPPRPKVLHTMTWLAPGGGVDHNVFHSVEALKGEYDIDIAVGCEIRRNPFASLPGVRLWVCPDLVRPISPFKDLKALLYLCRLIRRERYDIVHTHEAKASLLTRLAARLAGRPFVIWGLHGVTFNDPLNRLKRTWLVLIEKWTAWAADLVIGVSEAVIAEYRRHGIAEGLPREVVYSGVDVGRFALAAAEARARRGELRRSLGLGEDALVLVNVGRFSRAKNQRDAIAAFARLKGSRSGLKLLLVGEGELRETCRRQAQDLGLGHDVVFLGYRDDVPALLSLSDLFVFTSLREGLPRAVVESYLCGVPAVSFEVEGIREIIENGTSGYITPAGDVEALSEKISSMLDDPARRAAFAEHGCRRALKWDHRIMAARLRGIYASALARSRARVPARVARFFDGYAGDFDSLYGQASGRLWGRLVNGTLRRCVLRRFQEVLRETARPGIRTVLDVGCGPGRYCEEFLRQGKSVVGIDLAGGMLDLARARTGFSNAVRYVQGDYLESDLGERFDAACLMGFFDYADRPVDVLLKLRRDVSREIYASFPRASGPLAWQRRLRYRLRGCPLRLYSRQDILEVLRRAGLENNYELRGLGRDYFVKVVLAPLIEPGLEHQDAP